MVSIVPLQRRTEAAARSIFPERRQEEAEEEGMDLSGTQGELPIPMHTASSYGGVGGGRGGHVLELHHDYANNNGQSRSQALLSPPAAVEENSGKKRAAGVVAGAGVGGGGGGGPAVKYRECLKNHAAAIGGNATDGCGEFMPSGEEGSLEALKCSACGCHRNFHRKELDDFDGDSFAAHAVDGHRVGRRLLGPAMPHQHKNGSGGGLLVTTADPYGAYGPARALPPPPHPPAHHQIIMPLNMIHTSESDEMDGGGAMGGSGSAARSSGGGSSSKKRFRTKFTAEQKARMLDFAERVGWRLQKLDDAMVQHFCQEIGVKRRVLKVWMHNNKHILAKKPLQASPQPQQPHHPMPTPPMPMPSQPEPSFHRSPSSPPLPLKLE